MVCESVFVYPSVDRKITEMHMMRVMLPSTACVVDISVFHKSRDRWSLGQPVRLRSSRPNETPQTSVAPKHLTLPSADGDANCAPSKPQTSTQTPKTGPRRPSSLLREPWPGTIMVMVGRKPYRNICPKTPPPRPKTRPCVWLRLCRRGDTRLASGDRPASGHSSAPS